VLVKFGGILKHVNDVFQPDYACHRHFQGLLELLYRRLSALTNFLAIE
jgi:hypothetical protein